MLKAIGVVHRQGGDGPFRRRQAQIFHNAESVLARMLLVALAHKLGAAGGAAGGKQQRQLRREARRVAKGGLHKPITKRS